MTQPQENQLSIQPSPALLVKASLPISECITRMQDANVGSLLITGEYGNESLVGIFTERDLLMKCHLLRSGDHWDYPIRNIMTSPVRTLPVEQLRDAPRLMIEGRTRHLPIVQKSADGSEKVLGILSMRDLLRMHENSTRKLPEFFTPSRKARTSTGVLVACYERNAQFYDSISEFLNTDLVKMNSESLLHRDQILKLGHMGAIILDLDTPKAAHWLGILKRREGATELKLPFMAILLDPKAHPPSMVSALEKLNQTQNIAVFCKPVNLVTFFQRLIPALEARHPAKPKAANFVSKLG